MTEDQRHRQPVERERPLPGEVALSRTAVDLRRLAESLREVFWVFDPTQQRVLYVSPAYEEVWGRSADTLLSDFDEWVRSLHADDRVYAAESLKRISRTGGGGKREYRIIRPDGAVRWVSDRGFAIHGRDGTVERIVGLAEDITRQKRAAAELRATTETFRALVESTRDVIARLDRGCRHLYVSPAISRYVDLTPEECIGKTNGELGFPEELVARWDGAVQRVFATGEQQHIAFALEGHRGRTVFDCRMGPEWDREGEVTSVISVARDVTEQRRAEEALVHAAEESAALFAISAAAGASLAQGDMLVSALDEIVAVSGAEVAWLNEVGLAVGDQPRTMASRGTASSLVQADHAQALAACAVSRAMLESDEPQVGSVSLASCACPLADILGEHGTDRVTLIPLAADGETLGILHLAWAGPAPERRDEFLLAVGRTLGLALQNQRLYRKARQVPALEAVNRIAAAAISQLDEEALLRKVLEMTCQALGSSEGAVLLWDPETQETTRSLAFLDAATGREALRSDVLHRVLRWILTHDRPLSLEEVRPEGSLLQDVDASLVPESGSLIGVPITLERRTIGAVAIMDQQHAFDTDDLSLLESVASITAGALQNARLYRELEDLFREYEATQVKLVHAGKMSALGRLTASLAHEINNPLQAVQGYLSLVQEAFDASGERGRLRRYLGIALDEVLRISDIVGRMRDFYRPGRVGFSLVAPIEVLDHVLKLANKELEQGEVRVNCDWEADGGGGLPMIEANAGELRQVFLNLILNAIEAMPDGGTLGISTAVEDGSEGKPETVGIAFTDTGVGIPPEVHEHLFEPFVTTKSDGSGLGLSISYGIVHAHGGEISAVSEVGSGTTFTVRLPVQQPTAE